MFALFSRKDLAWLSTVMMAIGIINYFWGGKLHFTSNVVFFIGLAVVVNRFSMVAFFSQIIKPQNILLNAWTYVFIIPLFLTHQRLPDLWSLYEIKGAFLFFSLLFPVIQLNNKQRDFVWWALIIALLVLVFLLPISSYLHHLKYYPETPTGQMFVNASLVIAFNNLHHSFLSYAYLIAILYLIYGYRPVGAYGWLRIMIIGLFFAMIILLRSKLILISIVLVFGFAFFTEKQISVWVRVFTALVIGLLVIGFNGKINNAIQSIYIEKRADHVPSEADGISNRYHIWHSAVDAIADRPFFGHGVWQHNAPLLKKYVENNYIYGMYHKYSAHNVYLQTAVEIGLVGLALFLLTPIYLIYVAIRKKNKLLLLITIAYLLFGLTEVVNSIFASYFMFSLFGLMELNNKQL